MESSVVCDFAKTEIMINVNKNKRYIEYFLKLMLEKVPIFMKNKIVNNLKKSIENLRLKFEAGI